MDQIKVTVIIPVYNIERYVGTLMECVARQTWSNMEVIVVNDGSTDGTLEEVKSRKNLFENIQFFDIPNGGVSNARNMGLDIVTGAKIFFWDGDDTMEPNTIERCVKFSEENHVNAVLYGLASRKNGRYLYSTDDL